MSYYALFTLFTTLYTLTVNILIIYYTSYDFLFFIDNKITI